MPDDFEDYVVEEPKRTRKGALKYQPADADWSLDRLPELQEFYQTAYKRPLPVTVKGQGSIHRKWGLDHRASADISLNPSTSEGQAFITELQRRKVPFLAFDKAIPGVATGPHIHVGRPSSRSSAKYSIGSQVKGSKKSAPADDFDKYTVADPDFDPYVVDQRPAKPVQPAKPTGRPGYRIPFGTPLPTDAVRAGVQQHERRRSVRQRQAIEAGVADFEARQGPPTIDAGNAQDINTLEHEKARIRTERGFKRGIGMPVDYNPITAVGNYLAGRTEEAIIDEEARARVDAGYAESERLREIREQFTDEDRRQLTAAVERMRGQGSVSRGIETGSQRVGSSLLYKLAALADIAVQPATTLPGQGRSQLGDYLRRQAGRGELSIQEIEAESPPEVRQQLADFAASSLGALPEIAGAVAVAGPIGGFAALGGLEAAGRKQPFSAVAKETAKGAAIGTVFKGAGVAEQGGINRTLAQRTADTARSGAAIGLGTFGVEKAFGADDWEAARAAATNVVFHVGMRVPGEVGRFAQAAERALKTPELAEGSTPTVGPELQAPLARTKTPPPQTTPLTEPVPPAGIDTRLPTSASQPAAEIPSSAAGPSSDVVRLYRADRVDAKEPLGSNWVNDPEYASRKYGAGQMQGNESIWYIDVPKKALDEAFGDWRAVSGTTTDVLAANNISIDPRLFRRTEVPVDRRAVERPSGYEVFSPERRAEFLSQLEALPTEELVQVGQQLRLAERAADIQAATRRPLGELMRERAEAGPVEEGGAINLLTGKPVKRGSGTEEGGYVNVSEIAKAIRKVKDEVTGEKERSLEYILDLPGTGRALAVNFTIDRKGVARPFIGPYEKGMDFAGADVSGAKPLTLGMDTILALKRYLMQAHPEIKRVAFERSGSTGTDKELFEVGRKRNLAVIPRTTPERHKADLLPPPRAVDLHAVRSQLGQRGMEVREVEDAPLPTFSVLKGGREVAKFASGTRERALEQLDNYAKRAEGEGGFIDIGEVVAAVNELRARFPDKTERELRGMLPVTHRELLEREQPLPAAANQPRTDTGQFAPGPPGGREAAASDLRTAARKYAQQFKALDYHQARREGLDIVSDDMAHNYFSQLRRLAAEHLPARVEAIDRAESLYNQGKYGQATMLAEGVFRSLPDKVNEYSAAMAAMQLNEMGRTAKTNWTKVLQEVRERMKRTGPLSGGGSTFYDVNKHPEGGRPDHAKIAYILEPVVEALRADAGRLIAEGKLKAADYVAHVRTEVNKMLQTSDFADWHPLNKSAALGVLVDRLRKDGPPEPTFYHGTSAQLESLEPRPRPQDKVVGIWFSPTAKTAGEYALMERSGGDQPNIWPVRLKMEKTYEMEGKLNTARLLELAEAAESAKASVPRWEDIALELREEAQRTDGDYYLKNSRDIFEMVRVRAGLEGTTEILKRAGYDSLRNIRDPRAGRKYDEVAVFSPEQVIPRFTSEGASPQRQRSLPKTLERSGRDPGTNTTYDRLPNAQVNERVEARLASEGADALETWYRNAPESADRTAAHRVLVDHYTARSIELADTAPRQAEQLMLHARELSNLEDGRSTTIGQAMQMYSNLLKYTAPGVLKEVSHMEAQGVKVPAEAVTKLVKTAKEAEKADREVKRLEREVAQAEIAAGEAPAPAEGAEAPARPRTYTPRKGGPDTPTERVRRQLDEAAKRRRAAKAAIAAQLRQLEQQRTAAGYWKRAMNTTRGLMVSQLSTAMRNLQSQAVRFDIERLDDLVEHTLRRSVGLDSDLSYRNIWRNTARQFKFGQEAEAREILSNHPGELSRMFNAYAGGVDVPIRGNARNAIERTFQTVEKGVEIANYFNRIQEFHVRSAEFLAEVDLHLRKEKNLSLEKFVRRNGIDAIPQEIVQRGVNKALEVTFSDMPLRDGAGGRFLTSMIEVGNYIPPTLSPVAFPRFMFNNLKFLYQHSPAGMLDLARKNQNKPRVVSRALVGTAMLLLAYQFRNSDHAGEKWYEIKIGGTTLDARPFGPFSTYLFMAEGIKRQLAGEKAFTVEEIAGAIGASTGPSGTAIAVAEKLYDYAANGKWDKWQRTLKTEAGEWGRALLTPVRQVKDLIGAFDASQAIIRDTSSEPFLGEIRESIPYADSNFPPAHKPTSAAPLRQERPALKATTGWRVITPKSFIERELDSLNFTSREIRPATGNPAIDSLEKRLMGPLMDQLSAELEKDAEYKKLSRKARAAYLRDFISDIREEVREQGRIEQPELYEQLREERKPARQRQYEEELNSPGLSKALQLGVPMSIPPMRPGEDDIAYRARLLQLGRQRRQRLDSAYDPLLPANALRSKLYQSLYV